MDKNIDRLIKISQTFGKNPDYIIAGGGNSSYKDEDRMWVKASGTSMADIDENGFVCLDRNKMQVLSEKTYSDDATAREQEVKQDLQNAILFPEGKRPSVEASMHEVIQYAFIMHTHPTLVNGVLCAKKSKEMIEDLFGDDVVYVPYTDPGYVLFKEVVNALLKYKDKKAKEAQIIFLENHGVFVGADSCEEIEKIYTEIEEKLKSKASSCPPDSGKGDNEALLKLAGQIELNGEESKVYAAVDDSELTKSFVKDANSFASVSVPFTPDNIVYCKSKYLLVTDKDDVNARIASFKKECGYNPKVIALEGKGLVCIEENMKSAKIVLDVYKDMMKVSYLSESFGGPRPMTQQQIDFIDNWEVENYRRKISKESK
ncbi:class II aldolase/adducin family protein [Saccharicrinis sp. 156]|uniref:class II aldolase/adducin family protein n=1 Tax=Saccharicrinis sp. 156 TaxID=3417574 RepID=UPI003D3440AE